MVQCLRSAVLTLAYLDPGSGSLVLQALVGGSAGFMVFVRHLWKQWRMKQNLQSQLPVADSINL
ncbi:MAG: hypothetical protein ACK526_09380 [Planctomyces sp.]|jgi:hypothetical protein